MLKRLVIPTFVLVAISISLFPLRAKSQSGSKANQGTSAAPVPSPIPVHVDGWGRPVDDLPANQKPGPAPVHDLSGIWEPADGWRAGTQASGPRDNPSDARHILPYTPLGEKAFKSHKPGWGATAVPIQENNDPFDICDPLGLPRIDFFNLRALQILQTKKQVVIIYQNDQVWRNIWMDGRELPKEISEYRWYGYSVGRWVDDYTFVAQTVGLDDRTWVDNAGRPHSKDLQVEETFHRLNSDILELTVTITDPQMYTKPWVGLNKFPLRLQSDGFDIREMVCSASEAQQYNAISKAAAPRN